MYTNVVFHISCLNRSFMNPCEPFRIPDYLYDQVEEFEALFNVSSSSSYQRILDNYPDPTCENLYEYVAISIFNMFLFIKQK